MIQNRDFVKVVYREQLSLYGSAWLTVDLMLPNQHIIGLATIVAPTLQEAEREVQTRVDLVQLVLEVFVMNIYPEFPGVPPKLKEKSCQEKYQLELF